MVGAGGGGGSTTTSTKKVYNVAKKEFQQGHSQLIKKGEQMKFAYQNLNHTLTLNQTFGQTAIVIIQSNPITLVINLGETKKINLDEDKTYDLEVSLISVSTSAEIKIKSINETIPTKQISGGGNSSFVVEELGVKEFQDYPWYWGVFIIVVILGIGIYKFVKIKLSIKLRKAGPKKK